MASIVDLNQPGKYLHWSIFTVSVSNLIVIAIMVAIFGLALLLPFPKGSHGANDDTNDAIDITSNESINSLKKAVLANTQDTDSMWTARVRRMLTKILPPEKLLPDRQPAYVASWVYVFGVATLAALAIAILSGLAIALGGVDWWHSNPIGHFFNSMHIWSVELFMAFMVIHLWGKFWMAAWRGRRALTWISGVVAFVASIVECFTGYLSQQNFDSQWIATNGKDAVNAVGMGAFFNLMNFGQMLLWHVVLIPLVLVAIVGAHILMVRVRGVSHPIEDRKLSRLDAKSETALADSVGQDAVNPSSIAVNTMDDANDNADGDRDRDGDGDGGQWQGPTRRYDILKEAAMATAIVLVLVLLFAGLLSSPDTPPVTIKSWAQIAPADFIGTAASELAGTSETATYGPPYNHGSSNVQQILISPQKIVGVREPINAAESFVLSPLSAVAPSDPGLAKALHAYESASLSQRQSWSQAYLKAVANVVFRNGVPSVPKAADGPVPVMMSTELTLARSGALDADLISNHPFYGTNFTKPLLFLEDGQYFSNKAKAAHLYGTQWGVMNEGGSYPGQPWLWLYTLWYQVPGFSTSKNVDLIAIYLTGGATLLLLGVPFVPGLRDIPKLVPVHRLIWRRWYADSK